MKWDDTCVVSSPAQSKDVDRLSRKLSQAPRSKHGYKDLCSRASIQNPSACSVQPIGKLNCLTFVSTYTLLQLSPKILAADWSCAEVLNVCCWGRQQKPVHNLRCPCNSHSFMLWPWLQLTAWKKSSKWRCAGKKQGRGKGKPVESSTGDWGTNII